MRVRFALLIVLAAVGSAQATDTFSAGHRVIPDDGQAVAAPMAWRYRLLQTAEDLFNERATTQAPGATLTFRLPKTDTDGIQNRNQVEIVQGNKHTPLPMISNSTFALADDNEASWSGAMVVVNRNFPKGEFTHPVVQVRSPGLSAKVRRMGDLRLTCAAQIAMLKAEGNTVHTLLSTASLFGLDICGDMEVTKIDAPTGHYDTVTIEDGSRRLVLPAKQEKTPRLGNKDWSDNARIVYSIPQ